MRNSQPKVRLLFIALLVLTLPLSFMIVNWRNSLSFIKSVPKRSNQFVVKVIDSNSALQNIRYQYLIRYEEVPEVPKTSSIEIDKETGWYRYTDNVGKFSFLYPRDWEVHTWDGRDPRIWDRKVDEGMSWEWYSHREIRKEFYPILVVDSEKNPNVIGYPFLSILLLENENSKQSDSKILLSRDVSNLSDEFVLGHDNPTHGCPASLNGLFICGPSETVQISSGANTFIFRLTGEKNETMSRVLDSFSFF